MTVLVLPRKSSYCAGSRAAVADRTPIQLRSDVVGNFHLGRIENNKPQALVSWRVTSGSRGIADAVAEILGGRPKEIESPFGRRFEVLTDTSKLRVVLSGPGAVSTDMKLWNRDGLVHHCDGSVFLSPGDRYGTPCGCPPLMSDRKAAAKSGRGPQFDTTVTFRLARDCRLGEFELQATSSRFAESTTALCAFLVATQGNALCDLSLDRIESITTSGVRISHLKTSFSVIGPANFVKSA